MTHEARPLQELNWVTGHALPSQLDDYVMSWHISGAAVNASDPNPSRMTLLGRTNPREIWVGARGANMEAGHGWTRRRTPAQHVDGSRIGHAIDIRRVG